MLYTCAVLKTRAKMLRDTAIQSRNNDIERITPENLAVPKASGHLNLFSNINQDLYHYREKVAVRVSNRLQETRVYLVETELLSYK